MFDVSLFLYLPCYVHAAPRLGLLQSLCHYYLFCVYLCKDLGQKPVATPDCMATPHAPAAGTQSQGRLSL